MHALIDRAEELRENLQESGLDDVCIAVAPLDGQDRHEDAALHRRELCALLQGRVRRQRRRPVV
jgi:hypothetical protein